VAVIIGDDEAGLLDVGKRLKALPAEMLDQAVGVAQRDSEHRSADRLVVEPALV
jgi:hypothetical protein